MAWTQADLDLQLKKNPHLNLDIGFDKPEYKVKKMAAQGELPLVSEMLYQEYFEFREKELSESQVQSNFFLWIRANKGYYPQLASFFAVPNGGFRSRKTAVTMKREGVEAGVPDILSLHPAKTFAGLAIEFKVKRNKPSDFQKEWLNRLAKNGFYPVVCWSLMDAQKITTWFYDLPKGLY